jgi:hypothetical protein
MANKDYNDSIPPEQRETFGEEKVREGGAAPDDMADDSDDFEDDDDAEDLDDEAEEEDEGSI